MFNSFDRVIEMKGHPKFDRILMPLPKSAEDFLDSALMVSKKGTIIHFYDFLNESDFYMAEDKIEKACKVAGVGYKIMDLVKCGQHAPHVFRICVDFEVC
jgi:tRNA (guanine37-N1)-methyltransferase